MVLETSILGHSETTHMGIDSKYWFEASLRIMDAPYLHEEIVSILGAGTESHKRGDIVPDQPDKKWSNSIWLIVAPIAEDHDISEHLQWIINFVSPHEDHLKKWMMAGAHIDIYVSYACNDEHRGFGLNPDLLAIFPKLGIRFEVSIMT